MKTLYLDNYKGFNRTFIPFFDVNFFVGENSTGKTSVLNLVNILSNPRFFFSPEFNNENVELGYFNEIVNKSSLDKTYFAIGIEYKERKNKNISKYIWMKFNKKNNLPNIVEYMSIIGDKSVLISLHSSIANYQIIPYTGESFSDWISNYSKFSDPKTKVSIPQLSKVPFGIVKNIIELEIMGESETRPTITPSFYNRTLWLAPIRAKAQRTYESFKQSFSPEGDHTPNILRKILTSKNKVGGRASEIISTLMQFGKESSLFDDIKIDEYSKIKGAPFAINILYDSLPIKITNVGYGVSQVLPLVVEILTSNSDVIVIQQPEVHLHPKAQAAFGELIYNSVSENKNKFIIETHSNFTINRFRYKLSQSKDKNKISGQILFFERTRQGTCVTPIRINDNGQYPPDMPEEYGTFFIDEELKMLEI